MVAEKGNFNNLITISNENKGKSPFQILLSEFIVSEIPIVSHLKKTPCIYYRTSQIVLSTSGYLQCYTVVDTLSRTLASHASTLFIHTNYVQCSILNNRSIPADNPRALAYGEYDTIEA